jgi:hypothetical protein
MLTHSPCFSAIFLFSEESLVARFSERSAVVNHPLLGGAKLMALTLKRLGVGFNRIKEKLMTVITSKVMIRITEDERSVASKASW